MYVFASGYMSPCLFRLRRQPLLLKTLEDKVVNGTLSPRTAAETCIDNILL